MTPTSAPQLPTTVRHVAKGPDHLLNSGAARGAMVDSTQANFSHRHCDKKTSPFTGAYLLPQTSSSLNSQKYDQPSFQLRNGMKCRFFRRVREKQCALYLRLHKNYSS